jgi:phosphoribosylglycinamide formyltransferase-1
MNPIQVAAGLVFRDGKLLITQRHHQAHLGGLWEFPGGKREEGESFQECLVRELREELGIEVAVGEEVEVVIHSYPEKTVELRFFRCQWQANEPQPLGCPAFKWVTAQQLSEQEFPTADARLLCMLRANPSLWRNQGRPADSACPTASQGCTPTLVNPTASFRIGVLGSGKGSNFVAIADACAAGTIPAKVAIVLSDVESAGILTHARDRGIPARYISPGAFRTKLEPGVERIYIEALREAQVDLIALAGFMRVLKTDFLQAFAGRVVNIHPSLLPAFPGLHGWKQAFDYGTKVTGCTVHFVDAGVDSGPIIGQEVVPVLDEDTPESLHQRIQKAEHSLYVRCVAALARGEVEVRGRRVVSRKLEPRS